MPDDSKIKQIPLISRFLIKLIQIILYIPIQIVFIPFAIIGLSLAIYKEMGNSKKLGVSYTAGQALQLRWIMHYFNTRPDPLSSKFVKKFPCESHFGMWSILGPLIISQRLFGLTTKLCKIDKPGEETFLSYGNSRTVTFDRIMDKYIDKMKQIVISGAGFDLRDLQRTKGRNIKVFEVDQINTQKVKIETLIKADIKHDWITYIPVDYSKESWVDKLLEAGFDKTKKTLFIWESVSMYLEADMVKDTLKKMTDLSTVGSIVAQDFYSKAFISGETSKVIKKNLGMLEKMGEPWTFGIDMSDDPKATVESFLKECGLKMTEYIQFGEKLDIEPFYCILEAEKL